MSQLGGQLENFHKEQADMLEALARKDGDAPLLAIAEAHRVAVEMEEQKSGINPAFLRESFSC